MNTQTFTQKNALRTFGLFGLLIMLSLAFNPLYAQDDLRAVKGIVGDEAGPLENATVVLQGTDIATTTNEKGEFTFPKLLKENDVLVFYHIGYRDQKITIDPDTTFINLNLTDYEIVILGALKVRSKSSSEKPN